MQGGSDLDAAGERRKSGEDVSVPQNLGGRRVSTVDDLQAIEVIGNVQ